ncbi:dTDP-4-dehydrorhamnose reductase [Mucilaginibacter myungsuensis]|uniref:dTDP-4-dehydrorhamnose reductase n=1 Tax=Mucilaginibacter myungsuensis TaxID=649104 RepID=A0A929KXD1_9SPHI|nr:dTDP-4-dehydrorhamnose reductase [Mucilaginibacter myungsuensis]MBE9662402.1 dTDP-4-dehydrorhamnose reductase [Mucilaginibacter myungsuensis]MDN3599161.1 dTDP-4-dehydrorhamnose reductase [Mucilaginibacter myungsuensis]
MNNTLVFGGSGQLGQCLKAVSTRDNFEGLIFTEEQGANILDVPSLELLFQQHQPQYIINCAAYTAVDKAETDVDIARNVNAEGPANLALLCKKYNTTFIHISTDFVFAGNTTSLLSEDDIAEPISVYGQTKLEGEQAIAENTDQFFILRTAWLYSEFANNFVKTMLRLGAEKPELKIIADQVGTPTYGVDLAGAILRIIASGSDAYGVYHYSNEGVASWYDFTKAIFDIAGVKTPVLPIRTEEYPTPAARPKFSVMDKAKIKQTFNINIPYWRDSLLSCINILAK